MSTTVIYYKRGSSTSNLSVSSAKTSRSVCWCCPKKVAKKSFLGALPSRATIYLRSARFYVLAGSAALFLYFIFFYSRHFPNRTKSIAYNSQDWRSSTTGLRQYVRDFFSLQSEDIVTDGTFSSIGNGDDAAAGSLHSEIVVKDSANGQKKSNLNDVNVNVNVKIHMNDRMQAMGELANANPPADQTDQENDHEQPAQLEALSDGGGQVFETDLLADVQAATTSLPPSQPRVSGVAANAAPARPIRPKAKPKQANAHALRATESAVDSTSESESEVVSAGSSLSSSAATNVFDASLYCTSCVPLPRSDSLWQNRSLRIDSALREYSTHIRALLLGDTLFAGIPAELTADWSLHIFNGAISGESVQNLLFRVVRGPGLAWLAERGNVSAIFLSVGSENSYQLLTSPLDTFHGIVNLVEQLSRLFGEVDLYFVALPPNGESEIAMKKDFQVNRLLRRKFGIGVWKKQSMIDLNELWMKTSADETLVSQQQFEEDQQTMKVQKDYFDAEENYRFLNANGYEIFVNELKKYVEPYRA